MTPAELDAKFDAVLAQLSDHDIELVIAKAKEMIAKRQAKKAA